MYIHFGRLWWALLIATPRVRKVSTPFIEPALAAQDIQQYEGPHPAMTISKASRQQIASGWNGTVFGVAVADTLSQKYRKTV